MKKLVGILLTFLLILVCCNTIKVVKVKDNIKTDALRFQKDYEIKDQENIYEYTTLENILDIMENGTGIIFLGIPNEENSTLMGQIINEVSKEKSINKVLYYNHKDIRENKTEEYFTLLDHIYKNEEDIDKSLPNQIVIVVKKGNVVGTYNYIEIENVKVNIEEKTSTIKNNVSNLIDKLKNS